MNTKLTELLKLLNELDEQAQELIDLGDSKEKAQGHGMESIIDQVRWFLEAQDYNKIDQQ